MADVLGENEYPLWCLTFLFSLELSLTIILSLPSVNSWWGWFHVILLALCLFLSLDLWFIKIMKSKIFDNFFFFFQLQIHVCGTGCWDVLPNTWWWDFWTARVTIAVSRPSAFWNPPSKVSMQILVRKGEHNLLLSVRATSCRFKKRTPYSEIDQALCSGSLLRVCEFMPRSRAGREQYPVLHQRCAFSKMLFNCSSTNLLRRLPDHKA